MMSVALSGAAPLQPSLFGGGEPGCDAALAGLRRLELGDGAWVDHRPGWVAGHDELLRALWTTTRWHHGRRRMYERVVDVPRLVASLPEDGPGHPLLPRLAAALAERYGRDVSRVSLAAYRDGRDSVAFHGDRLGRAAGDAVVAIVSLGAPRRFLLRPVRGGRSLGFDLGWGDLLVMGGSCQRTWQHGVPKTTQAAGLRISVQFRSAPVVPLEDDGWPHRGP
jgi:alkylated DNA repair dioxygenase AlkB